MPSSQPRLTLGEYVKILRERIKPKMTQEDLAEKAGIGLNTLRSIESGATSNPEVTTLKALATALEVDVRELTWYLLESNTDGPMEPAFVARNHIGRRASDVQVSHRARDVAESYDNLPGAAKLAIDAIITAFTEALAERSEKK